jgi:hypothetical protein
MILAETHRGGFASRGTYGSWISHASAATSRVVMADRRDAAQPVCRECPKEIWFAGRVAGRKIILAYSGTDQLVPRAHCPERPSA